MVARVRKWLLQKATAQAGTPSDSFVLERKRRGTYTGTIGRTAKVLGGWSCSCPNNEKTTEKKKRRNGRQREKGKNPQSLKRKITTLEKPHHLSQINAGIKN